MAKQIAVKAGKAVMRGSARNRIAWTMNIDRKTQRRPMRSENHAQRNLPAPFATEMIPTSPAATAAVTPVISCAMGAACEMMEIPAEVFRNSNAHRAYHCQLRMDSARVYVLLERCRCCVALGAHPAGR